MEFKNRSVYLLQDKCWDGCLTLVASKSLKILRGGDSKVLLSLGGDRAKMG